VWRKERKGGLRGGRGRERKDSKPNPLNAGTKEGAPILGSMKPEKTTLGKRKEALEGIRLEENLGEGGGQLGVLNIRKSRKKDRKYIRGET